MKNEETIVAAMRVLLFMFDGVVGFVNCTRLVAFVTDVVDDTASLTTFGNRGSNGLALGQAG